MAFEKLKFTKNWENASDFPTVETSETQVRKDMQLLHDEAKDALNALVDKLNEKQLDGYPAGGVVKSLGTDHSTVPTSKAVRDAIVFAGGLPNGGTEGQVLRKKSDTDFDFDWDTMQSPIAALGLLKGLGQGEVAAAVAGTDYVAPSDPALLALKRHTWRRRTHTVVEGDVQTVGTSGSEDIEVKWNTAQPFCIFYKVGEDGNAGADWATAVQANHAKGLVEYADGAKQETETYTTIYTLRTKSTVMLGNYMLRYGHMWKIPSDAVATIKTDTNGQNEKVWMLYWSKMQPVTLQTGDWEIVTSVSPTAYPKDGFSNEYYYEYLGNFLQESMPFAARINTGYFWGSGVDGTVTCKVGFRPKFFFVYQDDSTGSSYIPRAMYYIHGSGYLTRFYGSGESIYGGAAVTVTDDSISWQAGAYIGDNVAGTLHRWVAIG